MAEHYNRSKFKELVLYLSQRLEEDEGFGMVKLNKLLYRCDFEAFRQLGAPITGAVYEKQEYGPVARDLPRGPVPAAREPADLSLFTKLELLIIENVLSELKWYGGKGASEWSHEQSAGWRAVEIGQEIPYGSAFVSTKKMTDEQMKRALQRSRDENWASIIP